MRRLFGIVALLFCLFFWVPTPLVWAAAGTKGGINIGIHLDQFGQAAQEIGPGGWVYLLACPGDIQQIESLIQTRPDIKVAIRGHYPGTALNQRFAEDWGRALRWINSPNKLYFMPANEVNNPRESVDPTSLQQYLTALQQAIAPIRGNKVYLLSPSVDVFYWSDHRADAGILNGIKFNDFDGVSLSLYGQYNNGILDTTAPGIKKGDVSDFTRIFGINKPIYAVETGVVAADRGAVIYGSQVSGTKTAGDDLIPEYLNSVTSLWNSSNVKMATIFSYNPDTNASSLFGWIYRAVKTIKALLSLGSGDPVEPTAVRGDKTINISDLSGCARVEKTELVPGDADEKIRGVNAGTAALEQSFLGATINVLSTLFGKATVPADDKKFKTPDFIASQALQKTAQDLTPYTIADNKLSKIIPEQSLHTVQKGTKLCVNPPQGSKDGRKEVQGKGLIRSDPINEINLQLTGTKLLDAYKVPGESVQANADGTIDIDSMYHPQELDPTAITCDDDGGGNSTQSEDRPAIGANTYDAGGQGGLAGFLVKITSDLLNTVGNTLHISAEIPGRTVMSQEQSIVDNQDKLTRARMPLDMQEYSDPNAAEISCYTTPDGGNHCIKNQFSGMNKFEQQSWQYVCSHLPLSEQSRLGYSKSDLSGICDGKPLTLDFTRDGTNAPIGVGVNVPVDNTPMGQAIAAATQGKIPQCVLEGVYKIEYNSNWTPSNICKINSCSAAGPFQITVGVDGKGDASCRSCNPYFANGTRKCPDEWPYNWPADPNAPSPCNVTAAAINTVAVLQDKAKYWTQRVLGVAQTMNTGALPAQRNAIIAAGNSYYGVSQSIPRLGGCSYGEYLYQRCDSSYRCGSANVILK